MYKLYEFSYCNAGTQEYYCDDVRVTDNPEEMKKEYENDPDNEGVHYQEFTIDGFEIIVKKI